MAVHFDSVISSSIVPTVGKIKLTWQKIRLKMYIKLKIQKIGVYILHKIRVRCMCLHRRQWIVLCLTAHVRQQCTAVAGWTATWTHWMKIRNSRLHGRIVPGFSNLGVVLVWSQKDSMKSQPHLQATKSRFVQMWWTLTFPCYHRKMPWKRHKWSLIWCTIQLRLWANKSLWTAPALKTIVCPSFKRTWHTQWT